MADSKYYWIKLRTNFFSDDSPIDILLSQPNGSEYVCLYLKLCLSTANKQGRLCNVFGEMLVPYDVEKIQRDMKYFSIDTVRVALELYQKLGLVYVEQDGILTITDHAEMVGCETKWAQYKRHKLEKFQSDSNETPIDNLDNVQQRIDIRDKDIRDKEKENKRKEIKTYYPEDVELNQAFINFIEMRKKIKAPMTDKAIDLSISKLKELSNGDNDKAIAIINQSIINCWKGLFPLKEEKPKEKNIIDEWMNA